MIFFKRSFEKQMKDNLKKYHSKNAKRIMNSLVECSHRGIDFIKYFPDQEGVLSTETIDILKTHKIKVEKNTSKSQQPSPYDNFYLITME